MTTKVIISNEQDIVNITFELRGLIRRCCRQVLATEKYHKGAESEIEISVLLTDDDGIRRLNRRHRDIDSVTDVLAFPMNESGLLGDIAVSMKTALAQAHEYGHSLERELGFLLVHATLHLLGYDHTESEEQTRLMRQREKLILKMLELKR
jgi:probable rRNA maturation factor